MSEDVIELYMIVVMNSSINLITQMNRINQNKLGLKVLLKKLI
ncbi:MAG: hypothetical protein AB1521_13020 [Bacteroidota bacterium]